MVQLGSLFAPVISKATLLETTVKCTMARCLRRSLICVHNGAGFNQVFILNLGLGASFIEGRCYLVNQMQQ
jgi:hypothetical protein